MLHKRRIVFVNPPYERIAPGYEFIRTITSRIPALGLLHLAAQARSEGYDCSIIESDVQGLGPDQVAAKIISERPAYVGITLFTVGVWHAAQIARKVKAALPETKILVGGPHISSMGPETIDRFHEFDIAAIGEGEEILSKLLKCLEEGGDLSQVSNLIYRKDGQVVSTPRDTARIPMDEMPMPAWDLLPNFPRAYLPAMYDYPRGPVGTIAASRGCPFHCRFCDTSTFGAAVRAYSPKAVFDQIMFLHKKWGVRHIIFVDDLFVASPKRTTELCRLILESRIKITWSCNTRVDCVKPALLKLMKKAGCWEIEFGLETGSNELLQKMEKIARVERGEKSVKWTADAGIRVKGLFMLGYPGETRETIQATKEFVARLPMTVMNLTKFTPYPGSPIYRDLYGTNIRDDHWEKMNGMNFLWSPPGIDVDELDREYREVLMHFYRRRKVRLHYLKMSVQNPMHLWRLMQGGFFMALAKVKSYWDGRGGKLIKPSTVHLDQDKKTHVRISGGRLTLPVLAK